MYEISYGNKYEATKGADLADIAKLVRKDIKAAVATGKLPAGLKASVRIDRFSGGQSLDVTVTEYAGPVLNPARVAAERKNPHDSHYLEPWMHPTAAAVENTLKAIVGAYNFDGSETMVDYYHVRFYGSVSFAEDLKRRDRGESTEASKPKEPKLYKGSVAFSVGRDGGSLHQGVWRLARRAQDDAGGGGDAAR
jgi:hypothetical protein